MSDRPIESLWEEVAEDRSRGSRELLLFALKRLSERLADREEVSRDALERILGRLSTVRPEMTIFRSVAALLLDETRSRGSFSAEAVSEALSTVGNRLEQYRYRLVEEFSNILEESESLLLFSRSGTVLDLLQSRRHDIDRIQILESRPGGEGVDVANCLSEDYSVEFYYDMEAPEAIASADVICVGADSLRPSGSVVNKVGTRLLGRLNAGVDLTVCTETLKFSPEPYRPDQAPTVESPMDLDESLRRSHPLFEEVPSGLITRYVTEKGVYTDPDELLKECSDLKEALGRLSEALNRMDHSG